MSESQAKEISSERPHPLIPFVIGLILLGGLFFVISKVEDPNKRQELIASAKSNQIDSKGKSDLKDSLMVKIPGGEFEMGSDTGDLDAEPKHKVMITAFYMDKYEVTQAMYEPLVGKNPCKYKTTSGDNPVERVTWTDCAKYCNKRSKEEGLTPCYDEKTWVCNFDADGYRLPTEAEWEYACRGGKTTEYFFGNNAKDLSAYAWFMDNSGAKTHPVGKKKPNPYGLYDILGNVSEWVHDNYDEEYYKSSVKKDPKGPKEGFKQMRGGSWTDDEDSMFSWVRTFNDDPDQAVVCRAYDMYGFRCVRNAK